MTLEEFKAKARRGYINQDETAGFLVNGKLLLSSGTITFPMTCFVITSDKKAFVIHYLSWKNSVDQWMIYHLPTTSFIMNPDRPRAPWFDTKDEALEFYGRRYGIRA